VSPPPCGGGLQTGPPLREAKGASSRIKNQFIAFLCDKTGGAQIGEMAEGSQICDFAKGVLITHSLRARPGGYEPDGSLVPGSGARELGLTFFQ
jgi:hypothetical protein